VEVTRLTEASFRNYTRTILQLGIRILADADPVVPEGLKPRKSPIQARSGATVEAIYEATIQVLIAEGLGRLTTTRVAARAGISVGTLYQYFPNKQALFFAILQRHFEEMAEAIEALRTGGTKRTLGEISDSLADAYVSTKVARRDATTALYAVAVVIDQGKLSSGLYKRLETAVVRRLTEASDASFRDVDKAAFTLLAAWNGLSRATFENSVPENDNLARFREEIALLSRAYLQAAADWTCELPLR